MYIGTSNNLIEERFDVIYLYVCTIFCMYICIYIYTTTGQHRTSSRSLRRGASGGRFYFILFLVFGQYARVENQAQDRIVVVVFNRRRG